MRQSDGAFHHPSPPMIRACAPPVFSVLPDSPCRSVSLLLLLARAWSGELNVSWLLPVNRWSWSELDANLFVLSSESSKCLEYPGRSWKIRKKIPDRSFGKKRSALDRPIDPGLTRETGRRQRASSWSDNHEIGSRNDHEAIVFSLVTSKQSPTTNTSPNHLSRIGKLELFESCLWRIVSKTF